MFFATLVVVGAYTLSEHNQPPGPIAKTSSSAGEQFDAAVWREKIRAERQAISNDIANQIARVSNSQNTPEVTNPRDDDVALAQLAEFSQTRLRRLSERFKEGYSRSSAKLSADDRMLAKNIDHQIRILKLLETIHQARAALLDTQERIVEILANESDPSTLSSNELFWTKQRPWLEAELLSLRYFSDGSSPGKQQTFLDAAQLDIQRLTQSALELEIRRVDAWRHWRHRHPHDAQIAIEYSSFIEDQREIFLSFSQMPLPRTQRQTLESGLRKVASLDHDKRR